MLQTLGLHLGHSKPKQGLTGGPRGRWVLCPHQLHLVGPLQSHVPPFTLPTAAVPAAVPEDFIDILHTDYQPYLNHNHFFPTAR